MEGPVVDRVTGRRGRPFFDFSLSLSLLLFRLRRSTRPKDLADQTYLVIRPLLSNGAPSCLAGRRTGSPSRSAGWVWPAGFWPAGGQGHPHVRPAGRLALGA